MKFRVEQLGKLLLLATAILVAGCAHFGERSRTQLGPLTPKLSAAQEKNGSEGEAAGETASRSASDSAWPESTRPASYARPAQPARPVQPAAFQQPFAPTAPVSAQMSSPPSGTPEQQNPPINGATSPSAPPELAPIVTPLQVPRTSSPTSATEVIRGQGPDRRELFNSPTAGNGDYLRFPMLPSEVPITRGQNGPNPTMQPYANGAGQGVPTANFNGPNDYTPILPDQPTAPAPGFQPFTPPAVDLNVFVEEARTGRFMFGAGVNSDLGVTGQIIIDERNFDPFRFPTSWDDVINGTAWRGAGQGFRLEAMPGSQVQRYLATHTMPYVYLPGIPEPFVLNTSGFYYTRNFFDWNEQRLGGRLALGYRITPDLSLTTSLRAEEVTVSNPRVVGLVPQLDRVVGDNELYSGRITLAHDTRDNAFLATQGHYFEIAYEQTFGTFDYPRG